MGFVQGLAGVGVGSKDRVAGESDQPQRKSRRIRLVKEGPPAQKLYTGQAFGQSSSLQEPAGTQWSPVESDGPGPLSWQMNT